MTECKSRLLVIEISVAVRGMSTYKILECWSTGVLGPKAEKDLIFILSPLLPRNPNMVHIFPLFPGPDRVHNVFDFLTKIQTISPDATINT